MKLYKLTLALLFALFTNVTFAQDKSEVYLELVVSEDFQIVRKKAFSFFRKQNDSLRFYGKEALNIADTKKEKMMANIILGVSYLVDSVDVAIKHYRQVLSLANDIGDGESIANAYNGIGLCYKKKDDLDSAIISYDEAIEVIKEKNIDDKFLLYMFYNKGDTYLKKGDSRKALVNYFVADSIAEANELPEERAYYAIAKVYRDSGERDSAKIYYQRMIDVLKPINNNNELQILYNSIALMYLETSQLDSAKMYLDSSSVYIEKAGIKTPTANLNNLGLWHFKKGNSKKAIEYYKKALNILESKGAKPYNESVLRVKLDMANALLLLGKKRQALKHAEQGYKHSSQATTKTRREYEILMSHIYFANDIPKKGFHHSDTYKYGLDTLIERNTANISLLKDYEKRELRQENQLKSKELEIQTKESEILKKDKYLIALLSIIGLTLTLAGIAWQRKRINKKNQLIAENKTLIKKLEDYANSASKKVVGIESLKNTANLHKEYKASDGLLFSNIGFQQKINLHASLHYKSLFLKLNEKKIRLTPEMLFLFQLYLLLGKTKELRFKEESDDKSKALTTNQKITAIFGVTAGAISQRKKQLADIFGIKTSNLEAHIVKLREEAV